LAGAIAEGSGLRDAFLGGVGFIFYLVGKLDGEALKGAEFFSGAFDEVVGFGVYLGQEEASEEEGPE
jgi:hypothetical protein